jgi:transglutaminase-like putative cysteine protease
MPGRVRVSHRTDYVYGTPMSDGFTSVHLEPRPTPWQTVESVAITIDPVPDELERSVDPFGNPVTRFAVHRPHSSLHVESEVVVTVLPQPVLPSTTPWTDIARAAHEARGELADELGPYLAQTALTPQLPALVALTSPEFLDGRPIAHAVSGLCHRIFETFRYDPGFTDLTTPLQHVLETRRGVCQDFAHVSVAALRSMGVPARYVSGYIETVPLPGEPKLVGVDASHAWCSAWAGALGWLDFDPTNDQMPPLRHVTVGWGRDYDDVTPVRGVVIGPGGGQSLTVAVDVVALD